MNLFSGRRLRRVLAVLALALALLFVVRPWQGARIGPDRIPDAGAFAPGDILLLGSSTWRGRFVKTADGTLFAHVALVDVDGDGGVWLVHASPQRDRVVREPIRSYFASNEVDCAALLRVEADPPHGSRGTRRPGAFPSTTAFPTARGRGFIAPNWRCSPGARLESTFSDGLNAARRSIPPHWRSPPSAGKSCDFPPASRGARKPR